MIERKFHSCLLYRLSDMGGGARVKAHMIKLSGRRMSVFPRFFMDNSKIYFVGQRAKKKQVKKTALHISDKP